VREDKRGRRFETWVQRSVKKFTVVDEWCGLGGAASRWWPPWIKIKCFANFKIFFVVSRKSFIRVTPIELPLQINL